MRTFICDKFWRDPDIEKLDAQQKLTVLWLFTNTDVTPLGFCEPTAQRFSFETSLPPETLNKTVVSCPKMFTKVGSCVFIRNYIRHQHGNGTKLIANNFFLKLQSEINLLKPEHQQVLKENYPEFEYKGLPSPTIPLYKGLSEQTPPFQTVGVGNGNGMGNGNGTGKEGSVRETETADSRFDVELPPHFPKTESEAQSHSSFVGCTPEFASKCWLQAMARGGTDSQGRNIQSWRHHLSICLKYDNERKFKEAQIKKKRVIAAL